MIVLSLVLVVASAAALGWGIATTSQALVWVSLVAGLAATALVVGSVVRRRHQPALDEADGLSGAPDAAALSPSGPAAPTARSSSEPGNSPPRDGWPWSADPARAGTAVDPAGTSAAAVPRSGWTGAVGPVVPADLTGRAETAPAPSGAAPTGAGPLSGAPADQPAASGDLDADQHTADAVATSTDRPPGESFPPLADAAATDVDDGEPPTEDVPVRDSLRVAQLDDGVVVVDGHPRYHLADCPTLTGAEPVPLAVSAARRAGFTPCGVCGPDRTLLARSLDRRARPATPAPVTPAAPGVPAAPDQPGGPGGPAGTGF